MPLQNRVTPFGNIVAATGRGEFTGNRGILHNPQTKSLHPTRRWASKAWIYCVCDFKGRKREVFGRNGPNGSPGWTNLFFLDEATALAAGHRPCFYCQREKAVAFQKAFSKGQDAEKLSAPAVDKILHSERLVGREKKKHPIDQDLPDGLFVADGDYAYLKHRDRFWQWSPDGYISKECAPEHLLTPPSIVEALRFGFPIRLHETARSS